LVVAVAVALPLYLHAASQVGIPGRVMARAAAPAVGASVAVAFVLVVLGSVTASAIALLVLGVLAAGLVALGLQWTTFAPFARSFLERPDVSEPEVA
jgi:hypothetical protein